MNEGVPIITLTSIAKALVYTVRVFVTLSAKIALIHITASLAITKKAFLTLAAVSVTFVNTLSTDTTDALTSCALIGVAKGLTLFILHFVALNALTLETVALVDTNRIFGTLVALSALIGVTTCVTIANVA